ncbi:hypothetical protein R5M92_12805 [Halomonas sp. Bachu 37]|uniref:hypothetical protein n=1 Tax=Halomonas kashgarensis TaxID=3084920 RepID=UPI003216A035
MNEVSLLVAIVNLIFRILAIVEKRIENAAFVVIEEYARNPEASKKCFPDVVRRRGKIFLGWRRTTWHGDGRFEIVSATYDKRPIGANVLRYEDENQKRVIEAAEKKLGKLRECLILIEKHRRDYKLIARRVKNIYDTADTNNDD